MRAELTPAVSRAVQAARSRAEQLGAAEPGPVHLLLGLLDESEGRVADLITRCGATLDAVLQTLVNHVSTSTASAGGLDEVFFAALELAIGRTGERLIGSEHVLLATVRVDAGLFGALSAAGVDLAAVEAAALPDPSDGIRLDEPLDLGDTVEQVDTARIFDAAANRAREALRVVEDYCRFSLDDAFLCREVKTLRHALVEALESAGRPPVLEARDTPGDVGTRISTPGEGHRESPRHVAQINLKRVQEALRSLEEFGKLIRPDLAAALEQLRYRAYTLEKALVSGANSRERLAAARLYLLVTATASETSMEVLVEEAVAGGVDVIQLREKGLSDRELIESARRMRRLTRKAGAVFIVNDRPDIARLCEADGVHLGQDDLPVREARRILGPGTLIGVSTHDLDQVRRAVLDGASYIGVGPVFPSRTKSFDAYPGLEFVRAAVAETSLPAFALGGISTGNVADVARVGATRIAVGAAICTANAPRAVAQMLRGALLKARS